MPPHEHACHVCGEPVECLVVNCGLEGKLCDRESCIAEWEREEEDEL